MALSLSSCPVRLACNASSSAQRHRRQEFIHSSAQPAHSPGFRRLSANVPKVRVSGQSHQTVAPRQGWHRGLGFSSAATTGLAQVVDNEGNEVDRRNIILPVDNSKDSDFAVSWALKHIYKAGDYLHLLYCIPSSHTDTAFSETETVAHAERQQAAKEEVQKRFEDKLAQWNVPADDLVYDILEEQHLSAGLFGVPDVDLEDAATRESDTETPNLTGDVIIKKAQECNAAAVVMASHNKGPIAEFFFGSITNYCAHNCPTPVVILHNLPHPTDDGHKAGEGEGRAIAVAVDDSALSEKSLQWTVDNVYRHGDTVHMMHVVPPLAEDVPVADGFGDSMENAQDGVSDKYKEILEAAHVPYKIDLVQEHFIDSIKADAVRLGTALVSKAEDLDASVLVMASHGKGDVEEFLLGSVTSFVTHNANDLPVVVLHP
eukprot:CAMPEP_0177782248 /NCGR_PEP_ID=MMETSP0491_2-20121128/18338_1 /TAXON_ID=63592 /ORGANISM="Tetraselmis chuii, Strain PLY429" /LENGTH=430 /DNA_ID=CAMNT_0019302479 /DNA_START=840 /DNA_END=2132 /DNA_ORIENTATION=-